MFVRICVMAAASLCALAACSPKAAEAPEAKAESAEEEDVVPQNPFFGRWQLVRAQVAPWWDGKGEEPMADTSLTMIDFEAKKSSGAPIVACDKPQYSVSLVPATGLFQGNLKEPFVQARALGFPINGSAITSLNLGCEVGNKDLSLDFPMLAEDTILLGLDNVIYTLQRTSK